MSDQFSSPADPRLPPTDSTTTAVPAAASTAAPPWGSPPDGPPPTAMRTWGTPSDGPPPGHAVDTDRRPSRSRRGAAMGLLALVAIAGGTAGGAIAGRQSADDAAPAPAPAVAEVSTDGASGSDAAATPAVALTDVSELVAAAEPSVVRIDSTTSLGVGTGTGFVTSADGEIATNAHVVGDASQVDVVFSDGTTAQGDVVGTSTVNDLAIVKVDTSGLVALELGTSDDLTVGQPVVAIGNALGLEGSPTATDGIVSALDRSISVADGTRLTHLIQTDAAINPGNSGGPLLTLDGKVVGINSAGSVGADNIGFAISVDTAKPLLEKLRTGEAITSAFLGVATTPINPQIATQVGTDAEEGLVITDTTVGSAADNAGLRRGDVITAIDGEPAVSPDDVATVIDDHEPGDTIEVEIDRAGTTSTLSIDLGSRRS